MNAPDKPHFALLLVEAAAEVPGLQAALRGAPFTFETQQVATESAFRAALAERPPDMVISAAHLAGTSASCMLAVLRESGRDIPLIVISEEASEQVAAEAFGAGAVDCIPRSWLGRLPSAIQTAIEGHIARVRRADAERALLASEAMKRGILNSLSSRIAVLDGSGTIVAVNKAWEEFGDAQMEVFQSSPAVGTNYGVMLEEALPAADATTARGIRELLGVIRRELPIGILEYTVTVHGRMRWFVARATPLEQSAEGTVISHEESTDRMLSHVALQNANQRLQMLSKRVLTVNEEERRYMSRELHDDIGQSLTALKIGLHRVAQRCSEDLKPMVTECLKIAGATLETVRNLSHELRPPQLDQLGLEDALGWLAERQRTATGLKIECLCSGLPARLPTELESACYRITQEAISNVARHAKAGNIYIVVEATEHLLKLTIRDDGVGFDPDEARQQALKSGSLGLISMEERAQLAGGRIKMRTVKGAGTTIKATFALSPVPAENQ